MSKVVGTYNAGINLDNYEPVLSFRNIKGDRSFRVTPNQFSKKERPWMEFYISTNCDSNNRRRINPYHKDLDVDYEFYTVNGNIMSIKTKLESLWA